MRRVPVGPGSARRFPLPTAFLLDISPLRESVPYRALWIGQILSLTGTQMRVLAVSFQIYEITGSSVAVGMLGLVEVVPLIVFSLAGGAVADRFDRRRVMFWSQLALMASVGLLALVSLGQPPALTTIYLLSALSSAFEAFDRPARAAIVPSLISEEKMPAAFALRHIVFHTTLIVGPLIAGLILAALGGRVSLLYGIDAVSFLAVIVALRWVPSDRPETAVGETPFRAVRNGLTFVVQTPLISSILVIDLVAMIFGMPRAVFPQLAAESFSGGPQVLGMLHAAVSAGALTGAVTTGWVGRIRRHGAAVLLSVAAWGLAITLAGLFIPHLPFVLVFLAIAGAADVISAIFRGTILNMNAPPDLLGRVNSVNLMVVTGGPRLGDAEAGAAAGLFGAPASVVIGGLACLVGTAVVAAASPLRRYVARSRPVEPPAGRRPTHG